SWCGLSRWRDRPSHATVNAVAPGRWRIGQRGREGAQTRLLVDRLASCRKIKSQQSPLRAHSFVTGAVTVAEGVYAPGHLGELTKIVDFDLADAVLSETRTVQHRLRLLPPRMIVYFVRALALFEDCSYRATWAKLTAALTGLPLTQPHRVLAGPGAPTGRRRATAAAVRDPGGRVGLPGQPGVC